jgi:hypothetical protein
MVIRDNAEFRRFWQKIVNSRTLALACGICALLSAATASAAPHLQPGDVLRSWSAQPLVAAGYERGPHAERLVYARRWEPEPEPYLHEERTIIHAKPDCVQEPHAVHTYAVHEPAIHDSGLPERPAVTYDEPCGIRCWYQRLRAGYCGRGCDYYRFRMTQFPEGRLGTDRVRVACR